MSALKAEPPPARGVEVLTLLNGDSLGRTFHHLFDANAGENKTVPDKHKPKSALKRKGGVAKPRDQVKVKQQQQQQRERSLEKSEALTCVPPEVELASNPSSFAIYCGVRRAVLTCLTRQLTVSLRNIIQSGADSDSESESTDGKSPTDASLPRLPKIVGLGLCSVFELVRETQITHPALCTRALHALLDILQGQPPEGLRSEPADVIDSLYQLLMELAQSRPNLVTTPASIVVPSSSSRSDPEHASLSALACSCLLSLVVACGDTGKLLTAIAAMFMYSTRLATQEIKIPRCLISLQRSVHAVLIGRTQPPDWLTHGVPQSARVAASTTMADVRLPSASDVTSEGTGTCLASDGRYLYLHGIGCGLLKIGSGYGNTIMGHVYCANPTFSCHEQGWLAVVKGRLLYKSLYDTSGSLTVVSTETLQILDKISLDGKGFHANAMFSDGESVGHVTAARDVQDSFVIRMFDPFRESTTVPCVHELPLKLARKCLDVFGTDTSPDPAGGAAAASIVGAGGLEEDAVNIQAGKEFALMRTSNGRILYSGKAQALGIKPTPTASPAISASNFNAAGGSKNPASPWTELPIVKSPKIVQFSVGHDGLHSLLVADDGSVFFVGVAKRGEDGDTGSLSKARRQAKAVKPKKMIRVDGKTVIYSACNSGTSALVTREGEVFMFGKDTVHCDHASGLLCDLKGIVVTAVALGKAHGVLLTNKGHVYTFGPNNKGQCGREYSVGSMGGSKDLCPVAVAMVDEDEVEEPTESICPPGKHRWVDRECMICTVCEQCTGYGSSCINSGGSQEDRAPGQRCGCGSGDSGCAECGACRTCAGESVPPSGLHALANNFPMDPLQGQGLELPPGLNLFEPEPVIIPSRGRRGGKNVDHRQGQGRSKVKLVSAVKVAAAEGSDHEQDPMKLNSLPPGRVELPGVVTQIVCGLHHTVLLLDNGDVYAFGSNHCGQLGVGDTAIRGCPTKMLLRSTNAKQVAAGSNHSVVLMASGQVYTCGNNQKGQLGRAIDDDEAKIASGGRKNKSPSVPGAITGIGAKLGRRATWVGASGDQTFVRIDESLINAHTLAKSNIIANTSCIGLIPTVDVGRLNIRCLMISRSDGVCRSFTGVDQASLVGHSVCLDPVYDNIWSYDAVLNELACYNVVASGTRSLKPTACDMLSPELTMPVRHGHLCPRSHCAINLLGCLDVLTAAHQLGLTVSAEERERTSVVTSFSKDDYSVINRFESYGGGWGYSGHSIEAVRFSCDTDTLLGGFGLFGGRGEYFGKIKLYELGLDAGDNEVDGELVAETDELPYRCAPREKFAMLFDDPVSIQANMWYVAWARISGPSSDCGSSGQTTVTTDDQIVFKFRSSKKSNNGTDANAGQIPQLLYRLPTTDSGGSSGGASSRKSEQSEPVHILGLEFSCTVSPECFESLLSLLSWSWSTFCSLGSELVSIRGVINVRAAVLDLEQLVYISSASLRLIRTYICEVYPPTGLRNKHPGCGETPRLAECVGEVRLLLRQILSESTRFQSAGASTRDGNAAGAAAATTAAAVVDGGSFESLREKILKECHTTFTACFHAFYPTAHLKWLCLCELLSNSDPSRDIVNVGDGGGRLLAAVMEALCQMATGRLSDIMPVSGGTSGVSTAGFSSVATDPSRSGSGEVRFRPSQSRGGVTTSCSSNSSSSTLTTSTDDNKSSGTAALGEATNFPMLVGHMLHQTEMELVGRSGHFWTFRDILDRLLVIAGMPIKHALGLEKVLLPPLLVHNACWVLVTLVGELAMSATGAEVTVATPVQQLVSTPNRFGRTSQGTYWNSGNGSPDAVCFCVDRPGIVIAGVGLYGGGGSYECDVELLDDMEQGGDAQPNGRWNTLEMVKAFYGPDDCVSDIAEIKFDRPVPIKENVKYAVRLRNRGQRTRNGDAGLVKVKCADGTVFTFSSCSLSSNGTNQSRGQIPTLLYYSSTQDSETTVENTRAAAEQQARKNTITVVGAIFRAATELLQRAQTSSDEKVLSAIQNAAMFSTLLPMVSAYIGPVAVVDPWGAVHVLRLVQDILPPVTSLSIHQNGDGSTGSANLPNGTVDLSRHYAIVESDHPYKPASVSNYRASFPASVCWMSVEFDHRCGTAQSEDCLQLYIPTRPTGSGLAGGDIPPRGTGTSALVTISQTPVDGNTNLSDAVSGWWPVLTKFTGSDGWPTAAVILPGNEVCFSLETASDYVKDEKGCFYGFRCTVVGYEWPSAGDQGLSHLEQEIAGLGGMCAAALMKKDIVLPPADEGVDDYAALEAAVKMEFTNHSALLSKGFSLLHAPTVTEALEGNLPLSGASCERAFLTDFIDCITGTSGGRLAAWLQPESYLDPRQCTVVHSSDGDLHCSVPVTITVLTRDQYARPVYVPNLKVEAAAVPVVKDLVEERRAKRLSRYDASDGSVIFGGHPPPKLDVPYHVTVKDSRDSYHAICIMKAYENYSFEELRYASPAVRRPTENMLIRDNQDGTYSATWTPGGVGFYHVQVKLDGCDAGEPMRMEVKDAPQGVTPPPMHHPPCRPSGGQHSQLRKFVATQSAGLRVRLHPSLQSEQIGIIRPGGIVSFMTEVHNEDGVWLRLSCDSIREFCSPLNGYTEGWSLQYNQHLGKTLLVPVDEPRLRADDHPSMDANSRQPPPSGAAAVQQVSAHNGFPCVYTTVKCGASGHNVRVAADLDSTAVGMVVVGNQLTAVDETATSEGMWIQLDPTSIQSYCHDTNGDAWCLARTTSGDVFLRPQTEIDLLGTDDNILASTCRPSPFATVNGDTAIAVADGKGFDFTKASKTPTFSPFASTNLPEFFGATGGGPFAVVTDGRSAGSEVGTIVAAGQSNWFRAPTVHRGLGSRVSVADPLGKARSASLRREASPYGGSPRSAAGGAAGPVTREAGGGILVGGDGPQQKIQLQFPDLPPELQGVSVKELVKALGESRVNGNGVTPPRTPPGTPKKVASRSSSPRAPLPATVDATGAAASSRGPSPKRDGSPSGLPGSVPPLAPSAVPSSSAPRVPSEPMSIAKNWLSPFRGIFISTDDANSAGNKSAAKIGMQQRSASSSPQRGADLSCVVTSCMPAPRASSSSPVRISASAVSPSPAAAATATGPFVAMATARENLQVAPAPTSKESSPTKVSRKDRSRRSKRDRAASPGKSPAHGRTAHRSDSSESSARDPATAATRILAPTQVPSEALSPSVALSMRAVFAAFLWHEGIVHDAMACASFLKFHPTLPKDAPTSGHKKPADVAAGESAATADEHSKEVPNINEAMRKGDGHNERISKERHISESHATAAGNTVGATASPSVADSEQLHGSTPSASEDLSGLPPTLRHLVAFWEELTRTTQNVISLNLLAPSPQLATATLPLESHGKSEKGKEDKSKNGVAKKSKDGKVPAALPIMLRGNLFGSAAGRLFAGLGGPVDGDKDVRCELCNDTFAHPVTYHMRQAHPGCGKPAGGQGYNSGGNFCGGWAGNCGDGGIGGSTWYLMCDVCRTKYLRDRKKGGGGVGGKDRSKKSIGLAGLLRKRLSTSSGSLATCEPHVVMRDNALFVLDLAGGVGGSGSHLAHSGGATLSWDMSASGSGTLSTVSEDGGIGTADGMVPFATTPFLYLQLRGASGDDTAFADENSESFYQSQHNGGSGAQWFDRSVSENERHNRSRPLSTYFSFGNDTDEDQPLVVAGSGAAKGVFQRSVSEMGGISNSGVVSTQNVEDNTSSSRRRNNSVSDNGMSLLKRPSANMERLIRLTEHDNSADGADRILRQPVVSFVMQRHDLDILRHVAAHAVRRAACRTYALQALNWLMRSVAHSPCLHELLWHFVSALSGPTEDDGKVEVLPTAQDSEQDVAVCSHPLSDVGFAGDATTKPLVIAFHAFLQTISDVMMHLPAGSALQRMAVRCWSLRFRPSDHVFLHRCHVFSHISRILSRSNCVMDGRALDSVASGKTRVDSLIDVTAQTDMRASSRQAMVGGMTDGSTETFWESGDEDKNKTKTISITCSFGSADCRLRVVCLHIDNARDIANKVSSMSMFAGPTTENQRLLRSVDLDQRHAGWVCAWVADSQARFVRLEMKGPDNSLRVRQIKLLGEAIGANDGPSTCDSVEVQRRECETETLSVFRLLTSLVFGRLVSEPANVAGAEPSEAPQPEPSLNGDVDLKEHMVGILFSHTGELTKLQRQVCAHIVGSIRRETVRVRAAWNASILPTASEAGGTSPTLQTISDSYCFELLSLVLALSGSSVGRRYIAQQYGLVEDLVSLLHAASPRVQRQVVALLRRILSDVTPRSFATLLGVTTLPPSDLSELMRSPGSGGASTADRRSILDVFLACIAKALSVQVKCKLPGVKAAPSSAVTLSESLHGSTADSWYMNGSISMQLAETIIVLIKDMSDGRLGAEWAGVTKAAVAAPIIALTRLPHEHRNPETCMHSSTMWLALAALCVLSTDHVERLSTGRWSAAPVATASHGQHFETGQVTSGQASGQVVSGQEGVGSPSSCPTCENHDDGETLATILCSSGCGSLCTECDRILHLSKKTRLHQRQVFKEEEESIRVDLHEGCGRVKLYWLLALADSKTLKSVVELRQVVDCSGAASSAAAAVLNSHETCRFCGAPATPDVLLPGAVCSLPECQEHARHACTQVLVCGHMCGGIRDEEPCLPCLHGCANAKSSSGTSELRQDADDMCMICFADALSAAPVIQLECGHAFHAHCCRAMLERRWPGPRITFAFMLCPLCKCDMNHRTLDVLAAPARALRDDVRRKALMRLEYEGVMQQDGAGTESPAKRQDLAAFAMQRYAYYVCHKCKKAYYGGEARCEQQAGAAAAAATEDYDPSELVCGACSDVARAQMCARHGADFLEYKCRYCCSVAVYFCFGTTHFCGACHDDFQRVTAMSKTDLPHCPAGPRAVQMTGEECPLHVKHPATGEEFALGCGICRNAHTF